MIPEEEIKRRVPRRSLVLFHDPDDDTMVTCLDGSNQYPAIIAKNWVYYKRHLTYNANQQQWRQDDNKDDLQCLRSIEQSL